MGKIIKLDENGLRKMIMSEVRRLNEIQIKSTDELANGDCARMCGMLKGAIESLFMWKDYCKTLEELQHLINRTFEDFVDQNQ